MYYRSNLQEYTDGVVLFVLNYWDFPGICFFFFSLPWSFSAGSGKSSKYFTSNYSSEASKEKKNQEAEEKGTAYKSKHESAWVMMDHTPERVLMNYQMPNRLENINNF